MHAVARDAYRAREIPHRIHHKNGPDSCARTSRLFLALEPPMPWRVNSPGVAMSHEDEARRWRSLAAEAIARVQELKDPEARAVLLSIAERYERLARQAEARAAEENSK